jgi:hypothetical protein
VRRVADGAVMRGIGGDVVQRVYDVVRRVGDVQRRIRGHRIRAVRLRVGVPKVRETAFGVSERRNVQSHPIHAHEG